ncbi:unnamed protein product [Phytophthora fragariaefolia]|uniref:Unnamed protein product n=1 Tax=Phytophthora fragariaefolia TaxID=1490495 RepID=A0A9W6XLQ3_9STRA|nr:unnamed protein product [Phytophthora fragariaefolia]
MQYPWMSTLVRDLLGFRARSEDAIGATHLEAVAQLQDDDESAVAMPIDEGQKADVIVEEIVLLRLLYILLAVALGQLDGRSIRGPIQEKVVVRTDFFAMLKAHRSRTAYKKTLRCSPDSFDALVRLLEPFGIDGDGIGGAAGQLGMSRTVAGVYIKRLEDLLYDMMPDVIYFPAPSAVDEWDDLVEGFVHRGSDFLMLHVFLMALLFTRVAPGITWSVMLVLGSDRRILTVYAAYRASTTKVGILPIIIWLLLTSAVNFATLGFSPVATPINPCGTNRKCSGPARGTCVLLESTG